MGCAIASMVTVYRLTAGEFGLLHPEGVLGRFPMFLQDPESRELNGSKQQTPHQRFVLCIM